MKKSDIKCGFETYGKRWGNLIWLVKDLDKKRQGDKKYYCVLGLSKSGWWHLFYGSLKECREYILSEMA